MIKWELHKYLKKDASNILWKNFWIILSYYSSHSIICGQAATDMPAFTKQDVVVSILVSIAFVTLNLRIFEWMNFIQIVIFVTSVNPEKLIYKKRNLRIFLLGFLMLQISVKIFFVVLSEYMNIT